MDHDIVYFLDQLLTFWLQGAPPGQITRSREMGVSGKVLDYPELVVLQLTLSSRRKTDSKSEKPRE